MSEINREIEPQLSKPELMPAEARELDRRGGDGLDIRLWWYVGTESTYVTVDDTRTGEFHHIPVPDGTPAKTVFDHALAYTDGPVEQRRLYATPEGDL